MRIRRKTAYLLLSLLILGAVGVFIRYYFFGDSLERRITLRVEEFLDKAEKKQTEGELIDLATAKGLSGFFTPAPVFYAREYMNAPVEIPQKELISLISMGRKSFRTLKLATDNLQATPGEDGISGVADFTLVITGESTENRFHHLYSIKAFFRQDEESGKLLIERVEASPLVSR